MRQSRQDSGHWLWLLQRLSGILLVITLAIHFGVEHFSSYQSVEGYTDAYAYSLVMARLATPWFKMLDMTFLTLAIFHGIHGLWMVGRDYLHSPGLRIGLAGTLITIAVVLLIWGAVTVIPPLPH